MIVLLCGIFMPYNYQTNCIVKKTHYIMEDGINLSNHR